MPLSGKCEGLPENFPEIEDTPRLYLRGKSPGLKTQTNQLCDSGPVTTPLWACFFLLQMSKLGQIPVIQGLGSLWGRAGGALLQLVVTHKLLCPQQPQVLGKQGGPLPQPGPSTALRRPNCEQASSRQLPPSSAPASTLGRCPLCCNVPIWHLSLLNGHQTHQLSDGVILSPGSISNLANENAVSGTN